MNEHVFFEIIGKTTAGLALMALCAAPVLVWFVR